MKIFIWRNEEEWQILQIFKSIEDALSSIEELVDIPKTEWKGPEQIHDTQWWKTDFNGPWDYIICYEVN